MPLDSEQSDYKPKGHPMKKPEPIVLADHPGWRIVAHLETGLPQLSIKR